MRECPCCKEYGDVWEVKFQNLNNLQAIMCFECDSVWDLANKEPQVVTDYESLMKEHRISADWEQIDKLGRVQPDATES